MAKNLKEAVLQADDEGTAATEPMSDDEEEENWEWMQGICSGLDPPTLWSGERVSGQNKSQHRRENKRTRIARQEAQPSSSYWARHKGDFVIPPPAGKNLEGAVSLEIPYPDTGNAHLLQYSRLPCFLRICCGL